MIFIQELPFFDDAWVRKKLEIMDPWDVIMDDDRTPDVENMTDKINAFLKPGRRYRMTIEDIGEVGPCPRFVENTEPWCDKC